MSNSDEGLPAGRPCRARLIVAGGFLRVVVVVLVVWRVIYAAAS